MITYEVFTVSNSDGCARAGWIWCASIDINFAYKQMELVNSHAKAKGCGCVIDIRERETKG